MARKVRLTDYNQRIEVPQGAALFLEGGDIVVDGEIGSEGDSLGIVGGKPGYAPGGGGSFSPTITDPQDGDIIARVGGVWVNSGNLKIGALVEVSGLAYTSADSTVPLDPTNPKVTEYYRNGLTLVDVAPGTGNGWQVAVKGRYEFLTSILLDAAGADVQAEFIISQSITEAIVVVPTGTRRSGGYSSRLELDVGAIVSFQLAVNNDATLHDSELSVQYIGPATSLS